MYRFDIQLKSARISLLSYRWTSSAEWFFSDEGNVAYTDFTINSGKLRECIKEEIIAARLLGVKAWILLVLSFLIANRKTSP
jgi:hypothetical protein